MPGVEGPKREKRPGAVKLTTRQERMVANFLRKTAEGLQGLPAEQRAESIVRIRNRMQRELRKFDEDTIDDETVAKLLLRSRRAEQAESPAKGGNGQRPPAEPPKAEIIEAEPADEPEKRLRSSRPSSRRRKSSPHRESDQAKWLGVCDEVAQAARVSPSVLRTALVISGVITGPIALWVYFIAYVVLDPAERLRKHRIPLAITAAKCIAWVAVLYAASIAIQKVLRAVYEHYVGATLKVDSLLWLPQYDGGMTFATLVTAMPLLLLATIPMTNAWDQSLRKWGHASIAVYALALFIGLLCFTASAAIQGAQNFAA